MIFRTIPIFSRLFKLVRYSNEYELHNLTSDKGEQNNIATKNPEIVAKIDSIMDRGHTYANEFSFEYENN